MFPAPLVPPRRLVPVPPADTLAAVDRRGGRTFQFAGSEQLWTLPEVVGPTCVLVPRGHGWPMLARRMGASLRALPHGEPCAPERWSVAGGVAARFRRVALPRGPAPAVGEVDLGAAPRVGWLRLRVRDLAWSALRRMDPSAGHGAVVLVGVGGRRIQCVSPLARARGLSRGMSVSLAQRHCPSVRVLGMVDPTALRAELVAWLVERFGGVVPCRGGWLVPWVAPAGQGDDLLGPAWLVQRLWQGFGVHASAAVGASPAAAAALGRLLDPAEVASVEPQAVAAWGRRAVRVGRLGGGAEGALWEGVALPDVEGVLCRVEQLAERLMPGAEGRTVRVRLHGEKQSATVRVQVPRGGGRGVSLLSSAVRGSLTTLGPVSRVDLRVEGAWHTSGNARGQLPLAATSR